MSGAGRHALGDNGGFIVVVVLWMLAALAALALIYLSYVTNVAVTVAVNADRVQADALVNAGLELAAYRLTAQNEATRPTSGTFNARVGAGRVSVTFRSEAARVDLNAATKPLLAGLMMALGVSATDAPVYADRIVAWRSSTEPGQDNPEDSYYRTLGASYLPRHAPFPHNDELWLVRGIPPAVVERVLPFVTVFSNMKTVNVLDAAPQVVAALPGMTPQALQQMLRDRIDPNVDPRSLVGLASGSATLEGAKAYRLTVAVETPSHRQSSADIVILLLESGDEPYRVLSWHNAYDGSPESLCEMSSLSSLRAIVDAWTGTVAASIVSGLERMVSPRVVRLVEGETGAFALEAAKSENVPNEIVFEDGRFAAANLAQIVRGSRVEIVLRPSRFLFRSLELPARAADFLDGIVRAQIDRLTPWSASEAVFGCSRPSAHGSESITTQIAAAPRRLAMGYVEAVSGFHPSAVVIATEAPEGARIKVFEQKSSGAIDPARLSRTLQAVLALATVVAVVGSVAASYLADSLSARESELEQHITQRRAALRSGGDGGERSPLALLERRKYETPASVIVLESLSRLLPDHTYVTEMHLSGNKIQIGGITRDAPSLIPLIEQSQHFTRATFYAPTTRSSSDPGERFHIEAQIEPRNAP